MAPPSKEQVQEAFAKADKDGNGTLCLKELKVALLELAKVDDQLDFATRDAHVEMMIEAADDDADKALSLDEILKLVDMMKEDDGKKLMQKMIRSADKDGNGSLSAAELKGFLLAIAPEDEKDEVDEMVKMFILMGSSNGEKQLKIEEVFKLLGCGGEEKPEDPKEKMRVMFRMCDTNGDGKISPKELATFMEMDDPFMATILSLMIAEADKDGDGTLNYEEFCTIMDKE